MIQHVLTNGMYLPFCSFLCPAQSLLWVYPVWGSFPVWSGDSLIIFQLFRCRNLALNRFLFLLFLEAGMFCTWGVWMPPYMCMPPVCLYAP